MKDISDKEYDEENFFIKKWNSKTYKNIWNVI